MIFFDKRNPALSQTLMHLGKFQLEENLLEASLSSLSSALEADPLNTLCFELRQEAFSRLGYPVHAASEALRGAEHFSLPRSSFISTLLTTALEQNESRIPPLQAPRLFNPPQFPPMMFDLFSSSSRGFGVRAKRRIAQGEVVLEETPLVSASSSTVGRCHHCSCLLSGFGEITCRCGTRFCSVACSTRAGKYHSALCGTESHEDVLCEALTQAGVMDVSPVLDYFRLARKLLGHALSRQGDFIPPVALPPLPLLSRNESQRDQVHLFCKTVMWSLLREELPICWAHPQLELQWVLNLMSVLESNVFGSTSEGGPCRLLLLGSFFNHSCLPNVEHREETGSAMMRFRAIREIKEGEELTISYIDENESKTIRREILSSSYHFVCDCPKCSKVLK